METNNLNPYKRPQDALIYAAMSIIAEMRGQHVDDDEAFKNLFEEVRLGAWRAFGTDFWPDEQDDC